MYENKRHKTRMFRKSSFYTYHRLQKKKLYYKILLHSASQFSIISHKLFMLKRLRYLGSLVYQSQCLEAEAFFAFV